MTDSVIGIDIGGTNIRASLFVAGAEARTVVRPAALDIGETPVGAMVALIADVTASDASSYSAIGMAITGPVDRATRIIANPFTLPAWSDSPWIAELEARLERPIVVDNDAMGAALGEFVEGAGRGAHTMCMVTLGTGIGVAVVDRESGPYRGSRGFHPEAGHVVIDSEGGRCYCGEVGCFEQICSGTAVGRYWTSADGTIDWAGYGAALARGIRTLSRAYAPDTFVFGGGVSANFADFAPSLLAAFAAPDPMGLAQFPTFRAAVLPEPGVRGAAYLASQAT